MRSSYFSGRSASTHWSLLIAASALVACGAESGSDGVGGAGGAAPGSDGSGGSGGSSAASGGSSSGGVTGGAASGGSSTGGAPNGSGGASPEPVDPCAESPWTCVPVPASGPYGERTFHVPARQNWVNTGLYLRRGETATLTVSGSWVVTGTGSTIDHGPCRIGDFVARVGLHYKDAALACVSGTTLFTADKDGVLFVGALPSNDLGETYETRSDDSGERAVTVSSPGDTVPTVQAVDAADYPWDEVSSGWVEVWGEHVILTLPAASAKKDAAALERAAERLDAIYDLQEELRGAVPHSGQRIRFFPDGTQPGYMLAGNPIRMDLDLVNGGDTTRISRSGEPGTGVWGFAHELGHDFSFAPSGFWTYQESTLESWTNVFTIYAFENLGLPLHSSTTSCTSTSVGSYAGGSWDAWQGLCFLRQFQFRYGWDFYKTFFRSINDVSSTGGNAWHFVHGRFTSAAGANVTPIFSAWGVPHP